MNDRTMTSEHLQCEWPAWVDAHRYELGPAPDERDADYLRAVEAERDRISMLEYGDFDDEDVAEFEAWLDSLEPSVGELELRDLTGGPFLGHDA